MQWLRDGIGVIAAAAETESLARGLSGNSGVYLVPAFVGLGAPHWDPHARGALFGITRDTGPAHLARAALESAAFQTHDLLQAMRQDGVRLRALRVDGGMVRNDWLMQFLADIVDLPVERPAITETSALGAAFCAGLQCGLFESLHATRDHWRRQARFTPSMAAGTRAELLAGWQRSLDRVRSPVDPPGGR